MIKKLFFLLCVLIISHLTFAQFGTDNQQMIFKTTEKVLFIIRQDYVLTEINKKDPQTFGSGGKDYFGRYYTLAVYSNNKLWCTSDIRTPWNFDPKYSAYKNDKTLKPILSKVMLRPVTKKDFEYIEMDLCPQNIQDSIFKDASVTYYSLKNDLSGISPAYMSLRRDGWLLLAWSNNDFETNDTTEIIWRAYHPNPDFVFKGFEGSIKEPPIQKNIIGGLYFITDFVPGVMNVFFSGVYNKKLIYYYIDRIPSINDIVINKQVIGKISCFKKWQDKRKKIKKCRKSFRECKKQLK